MCSKAIQIDVVTHLHFLLLLTKDKLHSMLTTAAPTRLPWPSGSKFKIPPLFWDGPRGRVEPTLLSLAAPPEAAGRRDPQVFHPTLSGPTLAPEKNPGQRRSRCARHLHQPDSKVSVRRQRLLINQKPASCTNPPPTVAKGQLMNLVSVSLSV